MTHGASYQNQIFSWNRVQALCKRTCILQGQDLKFADPTTYESSHSWKPQDIYPHAMESLRVWEALLIVHRMDVAPCSRSLDSHLQKTRSGFDRCFGSGMITGTGSSSPVRYVNHSCDHTDPPSGLVCHSLQMGDTLENLASLCRWKASHQFTTSSTIAAAISITSIALHNWALYCWQQQILKVLQSLNIY